MSAPLNERKPARPNIILFLTDQQRFDQVGYTSDGYFDTPNIDSLARQGIIFENAYSTCTVCVPARCGLLTGIQHHRLPTVSEGLLRSLALREGFWTVPHVLRDAGYHTALIGKMHFSPIHAQHGFDRMRMCENLTKAAGYWRGDMDDYHQWLVWEGRADWRATHMFGPGLKKEAREFRGNRQAIPFHFAKRFHPTSWVRRETIEFLKSHEREKPFFLISSFRHPHTPYDPPEPYASMYDVSDTILPAEDLAVNDGLPPTFREAMSMGQEFPIDLRRRALTYIRALIKHIDDEVGRILKEVDLSNTYVFFTSDHGDYSGHRGLMSKTPWVPFDDLARVPFFCAGPGIPKGRRVKNLVQNYDFAVTCLELAGVEVPAVLDAESLTPFFDGTKVAEEDRSVLCCTTPEFVWPMLRQNKFKYIVSTSSGEEILFDIDNDPRETVNLIDDLSHASRLEEFRTQMRLELNRGIPDLPWYR